MTDQTKLREAVARAVDPEAYDNDEYTQIKGRRRVYAEVAADRILALPEIADALKREEAFHIVHWLQKNGRFQDDRKTFTIYFDVPTVKMHTLTEACRAAMSGGEKK